MWTFVTYHFAFLKSCVLLDTGAAAAALVMRAA
jgi:hypothetical protein